MQTVQISQIVRPPPEAAPQRAAPGDRDVDDGLPFALDLAPQERSADSKDPELPVAEPKPEARDPSSSDTQETAPSEMADIPDWWRIALPPAAPMRGVETGAGIGPASDQPDKEPAPEAVTIALPADRVAVSGRSSQDSWHVGPAEPPDAAPSAPEQRSSGEIAETVSADAPQPPGGRAPGADSATDGAAAIAAASRRDGFPLGAAVTGEMSAEAMPDPVSGKTAPASLPVGEAGPVQSSPRADTEPRVGAPIPRLVESSPPPADYPGGIGVEAEGAAAAARPAATIRASLVSPIFAAAGFGVDTRAILHDVESKASGTESGPPLLRSGGGDGTPPELAAPSLGPAKPAAPAPVAVSALPVAGQKTLIWSSSEQEEGAGGSQVAPPAVELPVRLGSVIAGAAPIAAGTEPWGSFANAPAGEPSFSVGLSTAFSGHQDRAAVLSPPPTALRADLSSQISAQISQALGGASGPVTEVRLSPEELGTVRIELRTEGDRVSVTLFAERGETLDLLRRHADRLMAEFRAAGFSEMDLGFGNFSEQNTGYLQEHKTPDSDHGTLSASSEEGRQAPAPNQGRQTGPGNALYLRL